MLQYKLIWSPNKETKHSTSAGGFYLMAKRLLENHKDNASVYGCAFVDGNAVKHIRVTTVTELKRLQGSKYIQSDMSDCFKYIKEDLDNNRFVLFSGTSCQAAAIKGYFGDNQDQLFVIDVVCHGVPSPRLWSDYMDHLEKKHKGILSNISFRNKSNTNRLGYVMKYECNGKCYTVFPSMDFYYQSFLDGTSLRRSCYVCPFVGDYGSADLSLADSNNKNYHPYEAVSLVIIRSEKGENLLDSIKDECDFYETSLEKEAKENKKLNIATVIPCGRENFYSMRNTDKMDIEVGTMQKIKLYLKNIIPTKLKDKLKRG